MLKITTMAIVVFSFIGCENDFDSIGTNIIGEPGFNAEVYDDANISVTNVDLLSVQTNNFPDSIPNLLGVYNDEVFGMQKASVLAQLSLSNPDPDFGEQPVLDSVVLNVPYYSTRREPDEEGRVSYGLDSVYGDSAIKLSIMPSNLFLHTSDPETNFESRQRYYSDMQSQIESNLTGEVLFETSSFAPTPQTTVVVEGEEDTVTYRPSMRLQLSTDFFRQNIMNREGSAVLSNNNNFQNFLRGIYFKVDAVTNSGTMMLLNFENRNAGITLYYTSQEPDLGDIDEDGDTSELIDTPQSYKLNFGPTTINTFEQEEPDFSQSENLYLKGGEGSMAILELFSGVDSDDNGVSDELEYVRENDWLINEANLIFHVNREEVGNSQEPERLYLYDADRNVMLADYVFQQQGQANPPNSTVNQNHLGILERDEDGNGITYRMRITQYLRELLSSDTNNVRLGLVVSQNVNLITNSAVRESENADVQNIPTSSIITPLGTVLHGPNAANEDKRLKLRIYYTEPKN